MRLWRRELLPMLREHHYGKHQQVDAWYAFPTWVCELGLDGTTVAVKPEPVAAETAPGEPQNDDRPGLDLERLSEGQTLYPVDLTTAEAAALNTIAW